MRNQAVLMLGLLAGLSFILTGCGVRSSLPTTNPAKGAVLQGTVYGGQQPVIGAQVYLYAAGINSSGGSSIAASTANQSVSLLQAGTNTLKDTNGNYYVTTDSNGAFSVNGDYTCASGQQLYLLALGGNAGGGTNSLIGMMTVLGSCPLVGTTYFGPSKLSINELTTVASAYALAGFASDDTHISDDEAASSNPISLIAHTGLVNAFNTFGNLVNQTNGTLSSPSNATIPTAKINSLANILAACVNSSSGSSACSSLNTLLGGAITTPGLHGSVTVDTYDTATIAMKIAQNPAVPPAGAPGDPTYVADLFNLMSSTAPYQQALSTAPNDWTLAIQYQYTANNLSDLAIDSTGGLWISALGVPVAPLSFPYSTTGGTVLHLSPTGTPEALTIGSLTYPTHVAVDTNGSIWVLNEDSTSAPVVAEYSSTGTYMQELTNGGLDYIQQGIPNMAIDGSNNIWLDSSSYGTSGSVAYPALIEYSSAGTVVSPQAGYGPGSPAAPNFNATAMAIAPNGVPWVAGTSLSLPSGVMTNGFTSFSGGVINALKPYGSRSNAMAFVSTGEPWVADSPSSCVDQFANANLTSRICGGSLHTISAMAADGSNRLWIANTDTSANITVVNSGTVTEISGPTGYQDSTIQTPSSLAIDAAGNVWILNSANLSSGFNNTVVELVGAAAPVVTPIADQIKYGYTGIVP